MNQVNELFKKKYGMDMSENAARSFMAPFVLADAINRAKSTDPDAIVKALLGDEHYRQADPLSLERNKVRSADPPEYLCFRDTGATSESGIYYNLAF